MTPRTRQAIVRADARLVARSRRTGFALMEVLVSVALLGFIGLASATAISQAITSVRQVQRHEREFLEAVALVDAATLWSQADLDRRLGYRRQGRWLLQIVRADDRLYRIVVLDSTASLPIVQTVVLRPGRHR
jgi:type II secretory pathway pseudopilin PulG